ncbi:MAG: hypothetical protein U0R64_04910 [Candidatus Nanopelagicales bacterium]
MSPERCPHCGAALATGAEWCSLCLTPVGSPQSPEPSPAAPVPPAVDQVPPGVEIDSLDVPPFVTRTPSEPPPPAASAASGLPDPRADPELWAARLAAEEGGSGSVAALRSRSTRFGIMIGGALAVIVVLGAVMLVLSQFVG